MAMLVHNTAWEIDVHSFSGQIQYVTSLLHGIKFRGDNNVPVGYKWKIWFAVRQIYINYFSIGQYVTTCSLLHEIEYRGDNNAPVG